MTCASPSANAGSVPGRMITASSALVAVALYSTVMATIFVPLRRASVSQSRVN